MIDALILPLTGRILRPPARLLRRFGVAADQITLAGFALGALSLPALAFGFWGLALGLILLNRLLDGLDGAVARLDGATDRGAFLDIALDFACYALVPLGFALADPLNNALPAAALITGFVATGSSFLAYAVIAAKQGTRAAAFPSKGIYYLGGLTEGTETIALFTLMCLFPQWFPAFAWIFAIACGASAGLRWRRGWVQFSPVGGPDNTQ